MPPIVMPIQTELMIKLIMEALLIAASPFSPTINPEAKKYDTISIQEVIDKQLAVVDLTASIMCMEHKMPMAVFSLNEKNGIADAIQGRINGTIVTA